MTHDNGAYVKPGGLTPNWAEHPRYGIWPCPNPWHTTKHVTGDDSKCPECPNRWWAVDTSECPETYALLAEIDWLRSLNAR